MLNVRVLRVLLVRTTSFDIRRLVFLSLALLCTVAISRAQFENFVTRKGDKLFDGERELRFISCNTPNLHYIEDYFPLLGSNPWRLPDEYEIRDALTTIKQMGGKVTRIYVLSVRRQDDAPGVIRHVEAPGKFNEEAFRTLDKVFQIANELGVRIIMPFVDNWQWWGGPEEYASFHGKHRDVFWTDPEIIADVKQTIKYLVTRKNTCTGTLYSNDKALLCWETGNELSAPYEWTKEIASYVKGLDSNHLLMDGSSKRLLTEEAIADKNLDILTTHHYWNPQASLDLIVKNRALTRDRKPYVIGEYGIVPLQDIRAITDTIINQGLVGGMIWSLRFHNRDGGFYSHYEYASTEAYRWPGFVNGDPYNERMVMSFLRDKAYALDGMIPPRLPVPQPPMLLPITDPSRISWKGSVGALYYQVEREAVNDTGWLILDRKVDESRYQYRPDFCDDSAKAGVNYSYRVRAVNESGASECSNTVGPILVKTRTMVDEMEDFSRTFQKDGDLRLLSMQDVRRSREDRSRLTGNDGSYVVYKYPADVQAVRIEWLKSGPDAGVNVWVADSSFHFRNISTNDEQFVFPKNDYRIYDAVSSSLKNLPEGIRYVKIELKGGVFIDRVEVTGVAK